MESEVPRRNWTNVPIIILYISCASASLTDILIFDHTGIISTMRQRQQLGKTQDRPSESLKHVWSRTGLINIDRVIIIKNIQHLHHWEQFARHRKQFVWHRERFVRDGEHREMAPWRILCQKCDGKDKVRFQSLDLVTVCLLVTSQVSVYQSSFQADIEFWIGKLMLQAIWVWGFKRWAKQKPKLWSTGGTYMVF